MNLSWIVRMAWRDSRRSRGRLLLYLSAIVLGTAALVAIQSLAISLERAVDEQSRSLLGADVSLEGRQPAPPPIQHIVDSIAVQQVREASFASMVYVLRTGGTRLVQVRAIEGGFPFYGEWETQPPAMSQTIQDGACALVDEVLMTQLELRLGDSLQVGDSKFKLVASLLRAPGESAMAAVAAPRVFISYRYLQQTQLVKFGSRVAYRLHVRTRPEADVEAWRKQHTRLLDEHQQRAATVQGRQQALSRTLGNLFSYFNLVGFIALVLGGVGVASAVTVYVRSRVATVAVLRCLGASRSTTVYVFLVQVMLVGLLGSVLGVLLGVGMQLLWPVVLADLLPVPVRFVFSISAALTGLVAGVLLSVLFALMPLLSLRRVSPLEALRSAYEDSGVQDRDPWRYAITAAILLAIGGFASWQLRSVASGLAYTGFLVVAFVLLWATAAGVMWLARRYFPVGWSFELRQGLAGLFRPNNQTRTLVLSLGLGCFLLFTLYLVQENLLQQANVGAASKRANIMLFDVQKDQLAGIEQLMAAEQMPVLESTPVVPLRLASVRGKTFAELRADSTLNVPSWAGEYRVSYRDSLLSSEQVLRGRFVKMAGQDTTFISVAEDAQRMYKLQLGDEVVFDVQGVPIRTYVGSIRKIDYLQLRPSYLWVFPAGVLERAPQTSLVFSRAASPAQSARLQRVLVQRYPNVSVLDYAQVISTVEDLLGRVALVVQFLAFFSVLTGVVVLVGAMLNSRAQRVRENVLLRTLGASRKQLLRILATEYFFLGTLAAVTGLLLACLATWVLCAQVFDTAFAPAPLPLLAAVLGLAAFTLLLGVTGNGRVVDSPPLEVLREENG